MFLSPFTQLSSAIFGDGGNNGNNSSLLGYSNRGNEPVTTKETERGTVNEGGIKSYAFSGMQGWRVSMEDAHMVCTNIPVEGTGRYLDKGHAIFGVMDGHGGDFTSGFAAAHFVEFFSQSPSLAKYSSLKRSDQMDVPGIELLRSALTETFMAIDAETRKKQNKKNDTVLEMTERMDHSHPGMRIRFERSGSTCVVVMITPSHIVCANAGDSRAILKRGKRTLPLSFDHKPSNIPELERISNAGGFVKCKRVDGDLAVSRGLGDFSYKSNEQRTIDEQKVIPDPEFVVYPRNFERDEFIVLACDGVWDVATNEECSNFIQELFDEGETDLGLICEEAMDTCLEKNSRDNMTISMVTFDKAKIATGMKARNVVWQRRTARQAKYFEMTAKQAATRAAAGVGLNLSMNSSNNESSRQSSTSSQVSVTSGSK